jgi:hypothetical protein
MEGSMGFFSALFGRKAAEDPRNGKAAGIEAAGVVRDAGGWYYEETRDFAVSTASIRIDQERPGEWSVRDGFCEIQGLNDPDRFEQVEEFFNGSYRWLELERRAGGPSGLHTIKVYGTFNDKRGTGHRVHLGYLDDDLSTDLANEDIASLWGNIRFLRIPKPNARIKKYLVRFDLMQADQSTSEASPCRAEGRASVP